LETKYTSEESEDECEEQDDEDVEESSDEDVVPLKRQSTAKKSRRRRV